MEFQAVDNTPAIAAVPLAEVSATPIEKTSDVKAGEDLKSAPTFEVLFKDAMDSTLKDVMSRNGLADTEENQLKALDAIKKILPELLKKVTIDKDKAVEDISETGIKDALDKRFMPHTAENYRKVIQILLGDEE